MKILAVAFSALLAAKVSAQSNTGSKPDSVQSVSGDYYKTHLLWFKGHWNADKKNMFITTPQTDSVAGSTVTIGGGGTLLTVSPQGTVSIQSKNIDGWNKQIESGLTNLEKFENNLQAPVNDAKEWAHHLNEVTLPGLNDLKQEWREYKIDNKDKALFNNKPSERALKTEQPEPWPEILTNLCQTKKPEYEKIMAFYKAHKRDKESDLTYPPPPAYSNTCIACDTSLEKTYQAQDRAYAEKFFKPEEDLVKSALGILRGMYLSGIGSDYHGGRVAEMDLAQQEAISQAFKVNKTNPEQSGACCFYSEMDLEQAIDFLGRRMYQKAAKLFNDYKNNLETARPVIQTFLGASRRAQLMGLVVDENSELAECAGLVAKVRDYYFEEKLMRQHDWSQLANVPFLIGLERQYQMLGGHESDFMLRLYKLLNSFHLYIEMDVKVGREGKGYIYTHLKGKAKITPEFKFANDACYRWVLIDDQSNQAGLPQKKAVQKIECDLLTNEFVGPALRPKYVGTRYYNTYLYDLKMDYCHPGKDTILLGGFIPEPDANAGTWRYPTAQAPNGTFQVEHIFQDDLKMAELGRSGKAKGQSEIMKQEGNEIIAKIKSLQSHMGSGYTAPNLQKLHQIQDLVNKSRNLGANENLAPILYIDFPLEIKNNDATLHDKRFDAKAINPKYSQEVIYGYYTVKITYEKEK